MMNKVKSTPAQRQTVARPASRGTLADSQDAREFYLNAALAHLDSVARVCWQKHAARVIPFPPGTGLGHAERR